MDPVHYSVSHLEITQAVVDRIKQRIHDEFPNGTDKKPVMRANLNISRNEYGELVIIGSVDDTAAEIYERFSNFITPRSSHGRAVFSRRFLSRGPELDQYVSELIDLLMLQKFCERYLN